MGAAFAHTGPKQDQANISKLCEFLRRLVTNKKKFFISKSMTYETALVCVTTTTNGIDKISIRLGDLDPGCRNKKKNQSGRNELHKKE